ncbi:GNAT family N-acetyltransferase [Vallitalea okinawensis]|uniref:GNAT family N-acetyltransferase n=1 Tax=Vallitalea okinawensis TaxID=2078660 RepID=UPI000CFB9FDF|nr:GNAT family N-acetyltransferase [Vallitalea okinawensis]
MENEPIKIIEYEPIYAVATVSMWRESKERAIGQKEIHSFEDHIYFLNNILRKDYKVMIAIDLNFNRVVGILASNEREISQLYIHVSYQGKGIGKRLLEIAKNNSKGKLTLFTFQVNSKAQNFYEKNGFKIIGRGKDNEENLEDIEYEWISCEEQLNV